jgi:hypothetical protein
MTTQEKLIKGIGRNAVLARIIGALLLVGSSASLGSKPARNVSPIHHPNLAEAQKHAATAFDRLVAAQKAKELLEQANAEINLAAEAANQRK